MSVGSALLIALLAAEPRWGMKFKAPDGCIGAAELAEAIEKKLGRPMFGAKPDVIIEGYVRAEGARRWRARLTLVDADGTVKGSREVVQDGASCRAIDESLALVAAVMIDPASALKGNPPQPAPEPAPPPPAAPEPPREEESHASSPPPPPMFLPHLPPRERWPGYLVVDAGNFTQDGRWMSRGTFYRIVGRPDLDASYGRRVTTKTLAYSLGSVAMTVGAILMVLQPANISCVRYGGTPAAKGPCLETTPWPLVSGAITAGLGLAAVIFGAVLSTVPTSEKEDVDLADTYNQKLKPPPTPVTASL